MRNKLLLVLIALLIVLSLVACGKKKDNDNNDTGSSNSTQSTGSYIYEDDNLTASELEKLESEFMETVKPEIVVPDESSSTITATSSTTSTVSSDKGTNDIASNGWMPLV